MVFVVVVVLVIMQRFYGWFGGCVRSWNLGALWDSGGSLGAPSELVPECVGVFIPFDVSR